MIRLLLRSPDTSCHYRSVHRLPVSVVSVRLHHVARWGIKIQMLSSKSQHLNFCTERLTAISIKQDNAGQYIRWNLVHRQPEQRWIPDTQVRKESDLSCAFNNLRVQRKQRNSLNPMSPERGPPGDKILFYLPTWYLREEGGAQRLWCTAEHHPSSGY